MDDVQKTVKEIVRELAYDRKFLRRVSSEVRKSVLRDHFLLDLSDEVIAKARPTIKYLANEQSKQFLEKAQLEKRLSDCERKLEALQKGFKSLLK